MLYAEPSWAIPRADGVSTSVVTPIETRLDPDDQKIRGARPLATLAPEDSARVVVLISVPEGVGGFEISGSFIEALNLGTSQSCRVLMQRFRKTSVLAN